MHNCNPVMAVFLVSCLATCPVRSGLIYHFDFEKGNGKPAYGNAGGADGAAVLDTEAAGFSCPEPRFSKDTPTGNGQAVDVRVRRNHGPVLVLPDSAERLALASPDQAMTVALWLKLRAEDTERHGRTLLAKGPWAKQGWWIGVDSGRHLRVQYRPAKKPGAVWSRRARTRLPVARWVHVIIVLRTSAPSPRGIEFFIDGQPAPLNQGLRGVPVVSSQGPVVVGGMNRGNGGGINALLDDIRIYDHALTLPKLAAEIPGLKLQELRPEAYVRSTPDGRTELALQALVDAAAARGHRQLTLPRGRLYIPEGVSLSGLRDFTLRGAGSRATTLVREDGVVVTVNECANVTLSNFAVDVEPLPFIQGTVTAVREDETGRQVLDFRVHDGYPRLTEEAMSELHGCAYFFDKDTRRLKEGRGWFGPRPGENVIRIDDARGRLRIGGPVDIGDYIVMKINGAVPFILRSSDSVRMEEIKVLASGSLAVAARFLTGDNHFRYSIERGPLPANATEPRLVSTNADGIQVFWCPGSVTFEGCDFGFTGDDCINISIPQVLQVAEVRGPARVLTTARMEPGHARRLADMSAHGDVIRLERYGTFAPLDDVPLTSLEYRGNRQATAWLAGAQGRSQGGRSMAHFLVELDRPFSEPVKVGDRLVPRKFLPEHFAIRNSRFHDTRARGLLIMGSNGVIENNIIETTYLSGIQLCHELPGFGGADWISKVDVRGNVLRNVCISGVPSVLGWAAIALCNTPISPRKERPGAFPWAVGHRDVNIVDNVVDRCYGAGILINGLNGGILRNNTIRRSHIRAEHPRLKPQGVTAPCAVTVMNSRDVELKDNRAKELGRHAEAAACDLGVYPPPSAAESTPR